MIKNPSYERTAISICSMHRQTWCSSITMIRPHQIIVLWVGSPQALLVVYVLRQHAVVPGTTATACCGCITRINIKAAYEYGKSEGGSCVALLSQTCISIAMIHPSPHLASGSGRRQRCSIWPEQSRELTPLHGRTCSPRFSLYVCVEQS